MPPNTVKVARPTKFGNPFTIEGARAAGYSGTDESLRKFCVEYFREWLTKPASRGPWMGPVADAKRQTILDALPELRGKNLACFCPPGCCHADVLLELANPAGKPAN